MEIFANPSTAGIVGAAKPLRNEVEQWRRMPEPRKAPHRWPYCFCWGRSGEEGKCRKIRKKKNWGLQIFAVVDALLFAVKVTVAGFYELLGIHFVAANHKGIANANGKFVRFSG